MRRRDYLTFIYEENSTRDVWGDWVVVIFSIALFVIPLIILGFYLSRSAPQ